MVSYVTQCGKALECGAPFFWELLEPQMNRAIIEFKYVFPTPWQISYEQAHGQLSSLSEKKIQCLYMGMFHSITTLSLGAFFLIAGVFWAVGKVLETPEYFLRGSPTQASTATSPVSKSLQALSSPALPKKKELSSFTTDLCVQIGCEKPHKSKKQLTFIAGDQNSSVCLADVENPPQGIASCTRFFPYSAESVNDSGWGCAFRAIQTCLSAYDLFVPFDILFKSFGVSTHLQYLYQQKEKGRELSTSGAFAPCDLPSGWADPFVGHMILSYYKIDSALEYIWRFPGKYNPQKGQEQNGAFRNQALGVDVFFNRLETHFQKTGVAPVMIDDDYHAFNITGMCRGASDTVILWISDTLNRSTSSYTVTLTATGKQLLSSSENGYARSIYFDRASNKPWMVLFPGTKHS